MSSSRIPCTRCGKAILPVTAQHYKGLCAICWQIPPFPVRVRRFFGGIAGLLACCLAFPFILLLGPLWYICLTTSRRLRFPHDLGAIREAIAKVHPNPGVTSSYLEGMLSGYFKNSPRFYGFSRDKAFTKGRDDGGQLRRGEIDPAEIPTYRWQLF